MQFTLYFSWTRDILHSLYCIETSMQKTCLNSFRRKCQTMTNPISFRNGSPLKHVLSLSHFKQRIEQDKPKSDRVYLKREVREKLALQSILEANKKAKEKSKNKSTPWPRKHRMGTVKNHDSRFLMLSCLFPITHIQGVLRQFCVDPRTPSCLFPQPA